MPEAADGCLAYDDLPDGVVATDGSGTVTLVNAAALRMLGCRLDDVVSRPLAEALPLLDPQGRDWWACTTPFSGLASRIRQPERLLTLARPGCPETDLLVTASYVRAADGSVSRFVISLRDTVARSRLERSGAELVSVVAHELRSPLTSVKGFTATLLAKWDRFTDDQKRLMLHTVNADADRVTRLIAELLDVSRIESGRLELRKQVVDLPALVRRDVAARIAAGESEERFRVEVTGDLVETWGDPDKLAQVVSNIIENALRHGAGTVVARIEPDGDGIAMRISDEGAGIADAARSRIFTKFWRANPRGGTGLGLFIAKGIVDAHGGTIDAARAAEGGALITVRLPEGAPAFARTAS